MPSAGNSEMLLSTGSKARWGQLDQIRALAAFLVFAWHFIHGAEGSPLPFDGAPVFPFAALFDEGHVGVALFMCLSGYIFAKLLDGKRIIYSDFIAARLVRLLPLLIFVFVTQLLILYFNGDPVYRYLITLLKGLVRPTWPNGGWSITVEFHFYLICPMILYLKRRFYWIIPLFLIISIFIRFIMFECTGSVQDISYWTIIGRIDQFLMGIFCYDKRFIFRGRNLVAFLAISFLGFVYFLFDKAGGFYAFGGGYPSPSWIWIILPTIEAICCSIAIAWFGESFTFEGLLARFVEKIGFYSYGIYLLHFFFVFRVSAFIHSEIMPLSNFYTALAWCIPAFLLMLVPAVLAYHIIEKPFQKFKPVYVRCPEPAEFQSANSHEVEANLRR